MPNLPPWHLWGGDKTLTVEGNPFGQAPQKLSTQICKINYGRPDTWRFFLYAALLETDGTAGSGIVVNWRLAIGVGRTSVTMNFFDTWTFTLPVVDPFATQRFCTSINGPILKPFTQINTPALTPSAIPSQTLPPQNRIDLLPAQDIQAYVDVAAFGIGSGKKATLTFAALFTPNCHVRPEWNMNHFPGGENEGH
jgi:hypothetical protein